MHLIAERVIDVVVIVLIGFLVYWAVFESPEP